MRAAELSFIIILGVMVAFYVIFIWPAQREQRKHQQDIRDLRPGDDVLTTAGFIAHVEEIETPEDGPVILHLELAPNVRVKALTSAVQQRIKPGRLEELTGQRKGAEAPSTEEPGPSPGTSVPTRRQKGAT